MALAAQKMDAPIIMLEEQVETGLADFLASYRSEHTPGGGKKDELANRFTLFPNKPIAELSHPFAKAYQGSDSISPNRSVYAMVLENKIPCRQHLAAELTVFSHPNLVQLLGSGTVMCSHLNESRLVLFFERPAGKLLSEAMKETPRLHEHIVTDYVLSPAAQALNALRDKKITHGNLGPASFFMGETPVINECISAPSGTLAHHVYQPVEVMLADPLGRGEADERADVYALGILALELIYGIDKQKAMPREDLIRMILAKGAYQTFIAGREITANLEDFLRGIFNDNPADRWGLDQFTQWLGGKRFNMIAPTVSKDTTRPFVFGGDNYFNPRVLAFALHQQWRLAAKELRQSRLDRWCETNLHRSEISEKVERALRTGGDGSNDAQTNEMITRTIAALDPIAPIRTLSLATRPDGIGALLAHSIAENDSTTTEQLIALLDADIAMYWSELAPERRDHDYTATISKLQKSRSSLKKKEIGFGMERLLYELNPALPCQSPLFKQHYVSDIASALKILDAIASKSAATTSFVDRHLMAFLSCKLGMNKEMQLTDLAAMPALSKNEELIALRILARAQSKHPALKLPGLCAWAGMRVERMLDAIHSRVIRKKMKLKLRKLAEMGKLENLLDGVLNRNVTIRDYDGFTKAIALHQINTNKIERYKNPKLVDYYARDTGGRISTMIAYIILTITGYQVISTILGI